MMKYYEGNELKNQVCVITGASGGLGLCISKLFLMNGIKVYMLDINAEANEKAARNLNTEFRLGGYPVAITLDVTCEKDIKKALEEIVEKEGKLDILINNAAILHKDSFIDTTSDIFRKVFNVNVEGAFLCAKEAYRIMRKQQNGKIINVCSTGAYKGYPNYSVYISTKHALLGLTKTISQEALSDNIQIMAICPDAMNTKMGELATGLSEYDDLKKLLQPEDTANAILFMLSFSKTGRIDNLSLTGKNNQDTFF